MVSRVCIEWRKTSNGPWVLPKTLLSTSLSLKIKAFSFIASWSTIIASMRVEFGLIKMNSPWMSSSVWVWVQVVRKKSPRMMKISSLNFSQILPRSLLRQAQWSSSLISLLKSSSPDSRTCVALWRSSRTDWKGPLSGSLKLEDLSTHNSNHPWKRTLKWITLVLPNDPSNDAYSCVSTLWLRLY